MSANKPDISQIWKYLNGELDARAMYELERQAQDDPFLMNVIRGMESSDKDHQPHLDALDRMLKERIEQNRKHSIPLWKLWPVAACLLIALGVGGWWLNHQNKKPLVAENINKAAPVADTVKMQQAPVVAKQVIPTAEPAAIVKLQHKPYQTPAVVESVSPSAPKAPVVKELSAAPILAERQFKVDTVDYRASDYKAAIANNQKPNQTALKEVSIRGYTTQSKTETTAAVATIATPEAEQAKKQDTIHNALTGKVAGLIVIRGQSKTDRTITGKVVDKTNGAPLPGISVMVTGQALATQTDVNGAFKLNVPTQAKSLDVALIGFEKQQVKLGKQDHFKIELTEMNSSLAEAVVIGYGTRKGSMDPAAHPAIGLKAYDAYLIENATLPGNKTGTVKLTFTVNTMGAISNIQITKGLTDDMNQKAIDLITNGPKWIGASDGKSKEIKLKIRFH